MSTRLALHLLGAPRLELDNAPVTADRRKTLALLAYLAVNRWQHHRDHVSALLWPDYDQPKAYTNLRHIVWEVGQVIGEGWIVARRDTIGLIPGDDRSSSLSGPGRTVWLDVARFKSLINESRAQKEAARRIPLLLDSVNLYRNHFLTGFSLKHSPVFNEWAVAESDDLQHQLARALTMLVTDYCSLKEPETAVQHAQRLVALDPLNEPAHRQLMQVYIQAGQNGAALKQYQTCEQILRRELGVDPQPETRAIYKQIRKGEFKSIQTTKPINSEEPQHNIPFQVSIFIGREKELDEITKLIADHRLVTLTGTGGIGKTRLSLKIGEHVLNEFPNGVWFVELASLGDPALVPQTVVKLFHIVEQEEESLTDKLIRVLRPRTALLILDNCEHLIDACAQLADTLLKNCPNLKILATSREPLGITGEAQYQVPPLGLPDIQALLEQMLGYESIRLFEERARLVRHDFALTMENAPSIAKICQRLDGIPLAIELAAARINSFPVEQLTVRLDESINLLKGGSRTALPRHQTLHACIDWSWNLLSELEHILLRRLSVFAGGWTLQAAEAVCSGGIVNKSNVADLLRSLTEKSLVLSNRENERYRMLETIHQYTHEKFLETDEVDIIRDKHLACMLAWAEQIQPEIHGRNQIALFSDAEKEMNNIRQAIEWGLRTGQIESSMRICIALSYFMDSHIPFKESRRWLEMGISHREQLSKNTLARTLSEAAWLAFRQNDPLHGIVFAKESLKLADELDEPEILADALRSMGMVCISNGDFAEAEPYFEKAVVLYQQLDNNENVLIVIGNLGFALFYQGKVESAIQLLEKHMGLVKELDSLSRTAWYQYALGIFKVFHGELEPASSHLKSSLPFYRQINDINLIAGCLSGIAAVATGNGKPLRAAQLFGASEAIHESIGPVLKPGSKPLYASVVAQTRAMLDEETFASAWAEGRNMTMEQGIEYALNDE